MDVSWNYDENGFPKDAETRQKLADRRDYTSAVIEKEQEMSIPESYLLSTALKDSHRQHLATAMMLYQRGKTWLVFKGDGEIFCAEDSC